MRHRRSRGYDLAVQVLGEWLREGRRQRCKDWQIFDRFKRVYGRLPSGAMRRAAERLIGPPRKR